MFDWLKKWHVVLALVVGLYLAIPKSEEPWLQIGAKEVLPAGVALSTDEGKTISLASDFDYTKDDVLLIPRSQATQTIPRLTDEQLKADEKVTEPYKVPNDPSVAAKAITREGRGGYEFRIPLARYKANYGQDLVGGTSLRYLIRSEPQVNAELKLGNIFDEWNQNGLDGLPPTVAAKLRTYFANRDLFPSFDKEEIDAIGASGYVNPEMLERFRDAWDTLMREKVDAATRDNVGPTIEKLNRRLNASGMTELGIIPAGKNEIEIKIPALAAAETERMKELLQSTGAMEFLLLPNEDVLEGKTAQELYPKKPSRNASWYEWYDFDPSQTAAALYDGKQALRYDPTLKLDVQLDAERKEAVAHRSLALVTPRFVDTQYVTKSGEQRRARIQVEKILVQTSYPGIAPDLYPIGGHHLKNAEPSADKTGLPAVSFELKGQGVSTMSTITSKHHEETDDPRSLAVAVDKKVYSAAGIKSQLSDQILVSGSFTNSQVTRFVDTLKSGSLPVSLTLVSEESVGPSEGADNIQRGMYAIILGAVLVFAFALLFYRRMGFLVILNLVLIMVLIMATMNLFLSTLTLPGIAGLVLTLGMAIDANILINERIKEERRAGAGQRAAMETGFKKAFSAILDGNVTTLITSVILAKIGTGPVAGFALTLSIGIIFTLYVALLVYKTSMFFVYEKGWITEIRGWEIFTNTSINFMKIGRRVAIVAFALMAVTFVFFVSRGEENYGIDFRGGSQIVIQLEKPMPRDGDNGVVKRIADIKGADGLPRYSHVEVQARFMVGEDTKNANQGEGHTRFELRFPAHTTSSEADARKELEDVQDALRVAFGAELAREGFVASLANIKTFDLRADFTLRRPDGIESSNEQDSWLAFAATGLDESRMASWFSEIGGTWQGVSHRTSANGKTQDITLTLAGITVENDDQVASKRQQFWQILKDMFESRYPLKASMVGVQNDFPTQGELVRSVPRKASVRIELATLAPVPTTEIASQVGLIAAKVDDPLYRKIPPSVEAQDEKDGAATRFVITSESGDMNFDTNGANTTLLAANRFNEGFEKWFTETGADNHVTKPFVKASVIGGRVAGETQARALIALIIALIAIVIYIAIRFKSAGWGYAAVVALIQDTLLTLGAIAVCDTFFHDIKIDLNAIAALMTVIGYSLNDTIVIFDRCREELVADYNSKRKRTLDEVLNSAINSTLSRTVLTAGSTFVTVLAMLFFGGPALKTFSLTLFFGLIFGTYSSVFRAGPYLVFCTRWFKDIRVEIAQEEQSRREAEKAEAEALAAISVDRPAEPLQGEKAGA